MARESLVSWHDAPTDPARQGECVAQLMKAWKAIFKDQWDS